MRKIWLRDQKNTLRYVYCMNSIYLFQCDNKEHFIERIKEMDLEVQKSLVEYIQQVN